MESVTTPISAAKPPARLRYQGQDTDMTLREGLAEYYASNSALIDPSETSTSEIGEYFANHDASHVAFGTSTQIDDELLNDVWTFFAVDVRYRDYVGDLLTTREEAVKVVKSFPLWGSIVGVGLLIWRFPALVVRSRRMTKKWPWRGWERYLDRPLREIRREFNLRVF